MGIVENIGIKVRLRKGKALEFASAVMKEQDSYLVPMQLSAKAKAQACVKEGDVVFEGSVIGKPRDRYGVFVYSPVSGKVAGVVQQLSLSGDLVDHVLIVADKENKVQDLPKITDFGRKSLLERLMISGMVDLDGEPCFIKYVRKNNAKKRKLFISCIDNDPYISCEEVSFRENTQSVIKGAQEFAKLAEVDKIVFLFSFDQSTAIESFVKYVKQNKIKNVSYKVFHNVYPLAPVDIVRHLTHKTYDSAGRFANGIFLESGITCLQFFRAVYESKPVNSRLMTIGGIGFVRKGNYEVKNGTQIKAIMEYVGAKPEEYNSSYKMICGGAMNGIAEESPNVALSITTPAVLFLTRKEFSESEEMPCNYCGKCAEICPARIIPYKIDEQISEGDYDIAKKCGIEACTSCGACSYICPQRRYLTQRITDAKTKMKKMGDL